MERDEAMMRIRDLRKAFLEEYQENIANNEYDPRDIQRLTEDDKYACVFLTTALTRGDLTKATHAIDVCFKWRKAEGVNDIVYSTFPEIVHEGAVDTICYHGEDNQGCPILYFACKKNIAKTEEEIKTLKMFITYRFEEHFRAMPDQKCVILMDMTDAKISNVSIEVARFMIVCMTHYYPSYLAYIINYQMPFFLTATWKVISAFLSAEQKKYVKFIKGKDILNCIDEEHLYPHMLEACKK